MPASPVPPTAGGPTAATGPTATGYPADGVEDDGPIGAGPAGPSTVSSFNYPQWQGELFSLSKETLPFFSAVGGGGKCHAARAGSIVSDHGEREAIIDVGVIRQ